MMRLDKERLFWVAMAIGLAAELALVSAWVAPARSRLLAAEEAWNEQVRELDNIRRIAAQIPSANAISERTEYRKWLADQAERVRGFFRDRTVTLTAPITAERNPTPAQFKDAYAEAVINQLGWLGRYQQRMRVETGKDALPRYPWLDGPGLPDPKDFDAILRAYWAHVHMYRGFLDADVRVVRSLKIGAPIYVNEDFDGMPLKADLAMYPESLGPFLRTLLTVSHSAAGMPAVYLTRVQVRPDGNPAQAGSDPLCSVGIEGYILLLRESGESGASVRPKGGPR